MNREILLVEIFMFTIFIEVKYLFICENIMFTIFFNVGDFTRWTDDLTKVRSAYILEVIGGGPIAVDVLWLI